MLPMAVAPLRQQTRLTLARQLPAIAKRPDAISLWPFLRVAYQSDITCQLKRMVNNAMPKF